MQAVPAPPPPLAKRRPDVPVEVLAARTLSLATLGPQRRAERRRESVAALEALAGASLLELRQKLPTRYWVIGMLSLMGKSAREIAALVGYAQPITVVKALRHPAVARLVQEVRDAQLERVLQGTFGVAATRNRRPPRSWRMSPSLQGPSKIVRPGSARGGRGGIAMPYAPASPS